MKTLIGLKSESTAQVADILNRILADEHVLYIKTRNAHWNVESPDFYSFHKFSEVLYKQLEDIIDQIAERIRTIGHYAEATLSGYLKETKLTEKKQNGNSSADYIKELLEDHETIIIFMRQNADKIADELNDQGSSDFLVQILQIHEKIAWLLRSHLV